MIIFSQYPIQNSKLFLLRWRKLVACVQFKIQNSLSIPNCPTRLTRLTRLIRLIRLTRLTRPTCLTRPTNSKFRITKPSAKVERRLSEG